MGAEEWREPSDGVSALQPSRPRRQGLFGRHQNRRLAAVYEVSAEGLIKVLEGSVSVTYLGSEKPQIVIRNQQFDVCTGVLLTIAKAYK
jgi:hypothetical protein